MRITGPRGHWTTVGDGETGPLFTQDDLTHDRAASFLIESDGALMVRALGAYHRTANMNADRCELPSWAPRPAHAPARQTNSKDLDTPGTDRAQDDGRGA
jgi:hypothetical protein